MSDFPSIPILVDALTEEHVPPEIRITQSISHKEARDAWGSTFRRRWKINLRALGSYAETLKTHYYTQVGPLSSFNFTPPQRPGSSTPTAVLCRYENATLVYDRESSSYWPASVTLIEVL